MKPILILTKLISSMCIIHALQPMYRISARLPRLKVQPLQMVFGGVAEKLGSLVELVAGQSTITEKNIESTLKVSSVLSMLSIMRYTSFCCIWVNCKLLCAHMH
jgi:hypothetical protein